VLVAHVLSHALLNVSFNRTLIGDRWNSWVSLLKRLMRINLSDELDSFRWRLTTMVIVFIKSMYIDYMNGQAFLKNTYGK
jgi:hypothetical protein